MAFFEEHSYLSSCQTELSVSKQLMGEAILALKDELRDLLARARSGTKQPG